MSFRKRLLIFLIFLLIVAGLTPLLAPYAVAHGLRWWLNWAAPREGLTIEIGKIEAPFLARVAIADLHVAPTDKSGPAIQMQASQIELDFDFRGWLFNRNARFLHALTCERLTGSIHSAGGKTAPMEWRNLQRLLPDDFRFAHVDFDVATASTAFAFRDLSLSASEVESGKFFVRRIFVTSPFLRQTFGDLRGATAWEGNRLTIAGVSLVPGLDLEALTIDLSSLTKRWVGLDFQLDAFGGTLRASFQGHAGGKKSAVDLAGSAADLSLAQISQAAGFLEPVSGVVRSAKFTFRGNPGEFLDATASVWVEARDFAWRMRRADRVIFGATFYDRRLQVDQLYVQQRRNELTVNGQLFWPKTPIHWSGLQFRGQVNATIPDANAFAQLFGAPAGDFAGALSATGEIDSLEPLAQGRLSLGGKNLSFRGVALDSLGATIQLRGTETTLENLQVRHGNDFLRAHGELNLKAPHSYSARLTGALNDLAAYAPLLPKSWRTGAIGGGITFDCTGDGNFAAQSGTLQIAAHGLQLPLTSLRSPLDVTLEGTYSPAEVFFRTCKIANDRLSLGGFVLLGRNFVELQSLQLLLDGTPRASGTLFLPVGVDRWHKTGSLLQAFDEKQKFDVDLMVDHLDLGALASALAEKSDANGILDGRLAAYGPAASLQVTTNWQLQNFYSPKNAIEFDLHYDGGRADGDLRATFGVSAPMSVQFSLPLRLTKSNLASNSLIDSATPFSCTIDCPALFLQTLPENLRPLHASRGILSGKISYANTWLAPQIVGAAQILDAQFHPPAPWPGLNHFGAEILFQNHAAIIPALRFETAGVSLQMKGSLTTAPPAYILTLVPAVGMISVLRPPASGSEISVVRVLGERNFAKISALKQAVVRGKIGESLFSLTTTPCDGLSATYQFDPAARTPSSPLLLEVAAPKTPGLQLRLPNDKQSRSP